MVGNSTRVALVTGGSRGIGRAIAERLGRDGLQIAIGYAGNTGAANEAVGSIVDAGGEAIAIQADVADEQAVAAMFDRTEAHFGGVDVVVNSAGRLALSTIAEQDLDVFDDLHRTNVRGAFVVAQQAARRLRDGGAFIGMSTSVVGTQFPAYGAYVASKSAVEGMTMILARELRGRNITANVVAPGPTATDLFLDGKSQEQIDTLAHVSPLERLGTPEDSRASCRSWPAPTGTGSTDRLSAPTEGWSDARSRAPAALTRRTLTSSYIQGREPPCRSQI